MTAMRAIGISGWVVAVVVLASGCGSEPTSGLGAGATKPTPNSTSAAGEHPKRVPGTSAFVNDKRVGPLYVGQYVGQLEPVEDGGCRGKSGSSSTGSISVTLRIDEECRVYVDAIEP